ncbi:MAG: CHAT domain-containing protein [Terriglobales bacterium]
MTQKQKIRHAVRSLTKLRKERSAAGFLAELDRLLNICSSLGLWSQGQKAVEEALTAWNEGVFAMDDIFVLLRHLSRFHSLAGQHTTVVDLYLTAASRFADFSAYQSAYRLLVDAEEYAIEHRLPKSLLEARETGASIALFEGDLAFAEKTFSRIRDQRIQLGLGLPAKLLTNLGTLQMRKGEFSSGVDSFRQVIDLDVEAAVKVAALVNCSACLRELDRLDEARVCLDQAKALVDDEMDDSLLIELDLIEAKTASRTGDHSTTMGCLQKVVALLDTALNDLGRLHYRRGLREQYRQRIAAILCTLPQQGATGPILPVMAFLKSNSIADWMALLDWHDWAVHNKQISGALRERLAAAVRNVAQRGAPILYGFREKYDDPWSSYWEVNSVDFRSKPDAFAIPWPDLNNAIREINAITGDSGPWADATSILRAHQLQDSLDQGDWALVVLITSRAASIFVMNRKSYTRFDFPNEEITNLNTALWRYQDGSERREVFMNQLQQCAERITQTLSQAFDEIASGTTKRILVFPEPFLVPVFASLLSHDKLRDRAKQGSLAVTVCPILHRKKLTKLDMNVVTACSFEGDGLGLDEPELDLVSRLLNPTTLRRVRISGDVDIRTLMESAVVHLAAHGTPISNLRDAFFASAHPTAPGFGLPEFQRICWETSHQLVFINSCFSADALNWNAFTNFATNEQMGLPGILLLNRRSAVLASSWKTFDVAAYVFAFMFYSNLRTGIEPNIAFTKSCAELYEAGSDRVCEILETITDKEIRTAKQRLFATGGQPFQHPYVSGTYQFISLV